MLLGYKFVLIVEQQYFLMLMKYIYIYLIGCGGDIIVVV